MPFWLDSWAGDNAGKIVGREPNKLLITVTVENAQLPSGLFQGTEIGGHQVYPYCWVDCLTPNVGNVYAIDVKPLEGTVFSIGVAQIGSGAPKPLTPGVHLFSVGLGGGGSQAATIATAIIDEDMPFIEFHPPGFSGDAFLALLRQGGTPPQSFA